MPTSNQNQPCAFTEVKNLSFSYIEITSRKNDKITDTAKLSDKKHRDRENLFFVEGIKLFEEALLSRLSVKRVFFTKKALELYEDALKKAGCSENYLVTDEVYSKLTEETSPQGIYAVIKKPEGHKFSEEQIKDGGFIILEDIQNPMNLGAIFRCAYSLGGCKLILSKSCADVYSPKTLRSGMGSIFKAEFCVCDDICDFIENQKKLSNRVFCTHLHSKALILGSFDFEKSDSIVIGNEGHGVSENIVNVCTSSCIIPMTPDAESLNAATASSIFIWEMNKSRLIP